MDWKFLLQTIVTVALAAGGWIVAHRFSSERDLRNKRSELRLKYLIESYRRLERICGRTLSSGDVLPDIESAICDLQLLGNESQVFAAQVCARTLAGERLEHMDLARLLAELRNTIRTDLGLPHVAGEPAVLRLTYHPPEQQAEKSKDDEKTPSV